MDSMLKPPYRGPSNHYYTASLFYGVSKAPEDPIDPVFHLYEDRPGLINARATFVELGDPTGYQWAIKYLGDWRHWEMLMKARWFREAYQAWLTELKIKLKSEAIIKITAISEAPGPQALGASKYLADLSLDKNTRGRPTKEEIQGELKRAVKTIEAEDADMERIGLKLVVNNGNRP